jgi:hypothetical protein
VRRYNGSGNEDDDGALAIAVDDSGYVYVTGTSATIKYHPNGDTAWVRTIAPEGQDIAVDDSGYVYVTGNSATIKYHPNGDTAWVRTIAPGGQDIAVDDSGYVYVTGASGGDYATIKYYPNGDTAWLRRYNGPGNGYDEATAIAVDGSGNVYVTGGSYGSGANSDYASIKYYPNGDTAWVRRYHWAGIYEDWATAIAVDRYRNVYVTGSHGSGTAYDYATIKYYSNGDTAWVRRYNGPGNGYDWAFAIALDSPGNVYVTGGSEGSGTRDDYATIKYRPGGGTAWVTTYNGAGNLFDYAQAIAVDGHGNVYVTGSSYGSGTSYDYATIKYVPVFYPGVDLSVEIWGSGRARPGIPKAYWAEYRNGRCDIAESVGLCVTLPSEVQFLSCDPPNCSVNGQNILWNLGTVTGSTEGRVEVTFSVPIWVSVGTILTGNAEITTTSDDQNPRNNRSDEHETVVTSWDPNDKDAQPWGGGTAHYIMRDQNIRYTIFFENDSGATAEAIHIDIVDTLDPNLDWSTLEIGPMSHSNTCEATYDDPSRVLTWHCHNIMLPPNHNPPEGEGFVSLSVKPWWWLSSGTQIKNRAYIKFDSNPWVAAPDSGPVIRTIGFRGDANSDGVVNIPDIVYLINYLFIGGPGPEPWQAGDVNCDETVNANDVVYLINYLFIGGPPPCKP